jgi:adenylate cyclase
MLAISVLVDVTLLMGLIWSFHIQYGQPEAFYLKAPTLLYIFIFIALRTLSFSPGYVLFTGAAAAAGWLALLAIAMLAPGGKTLITRDYIAYMTSSKILIGAEIDKVISILLVSLVLSAAVSRANKLLHSAVTEEAAVSDLSRFFEADAAREIISAGNSLKPGDGRQAEAAVMFIDLRGFTRLASTIPAQHVVELLNEYHSIVVPVVQSNSGSISTYLGDGILVTFGAMYRDPTFAADAMRTAEQLLDAYDSWSGERTARGKPPLGIGIGVNHGTVVVGAIGDASRLEFAVIGDSVNTASKLQNHTKTEKVRALASAETRDLAARQGYDDKRCGKILPQRSVAGVANPMDLVEIS